MSKRFPNHVLVRHNATDDYPLIVGEPENLTLADAEDGDKLGVYVLQQVVTFRQNARLEKKRGG